MKGRFFHFISLTIRLCGGEHQASGSAKPIRRSPRKMPPTDPPIAGARRHFSVLCFLTCLLFSPLIADDKPTPPPPTAIVPYDPSQAITSQTPARYYLDYETFQRMWDEVKAHREREITTAGPDVPADHALSTALYRVDMSEDRIAVTGRLSLTTRGKDWQRVPLAFSGINLGAISLDGNPASYRDGTILVEKAGQHLVEVKFEIPVGESTSDVAAWKIPPSAATLLQITMDSEGAEPVLQENWPLAKSRASASGPTIYNAALGFRSDIKLRRRLKTTGRGMTRPNLAEIDARLFVADGLERLEATYRLGFEGQEDDRFTISYDASLKPIQFDIPNLATWETVGNGTGGQRTLTFTLTEPVRDRIEVGLVAERLASGVEREFPRLGADATRITQERSLLRVTDLEVKANPDSSHRQVAFPGGNQQPGGFIPVAAFSLTGDSAETLAYAATTRKPERSAEASFVYQVGSGKLETIVRFAILSPKAPLVSNSFLLPADTKVQLVEGNRIRDWWRTGDELFVRYAGGTPATTNVLVYLTRQLAEDEGAEIAIEPVRIAGFDADKVTGDGLVVGHVTRDVALSLLPSRRVAREVGTDEVANDFEVITPLERKRGFRFEQSDFTGTIALSDVAPKYNALWVMLARVRESYAKISLQADIEVTRSGLNRVEFTTPEVFPELRVVSDDVRELTHKLADGVRSYEIVFQQYVTDAVSFTLETEIPHGGELSLPDLAFPDATRQERFVIVENHSRERMTTAADGLDKTVESLLPYKPGNILPSASLFRAQPGWSLTADLEQLQTSAGNAAVILYADLTTSIRANGEEWLKAVYHIQNRSLQFLPVLPPSGAELMSVVVDGQEVRSDRGEIEGRPSLLVPLIQTKLGQLAYDVELVFRTQHLSSVASAKGEGEVGESTLLNEIDRRLDDPLVIGPTVEKTFWRVYLPAGHEVDDTDGNMNRVAQDRRLLALLQSDIGELQALNNVASDFDNGLSTRNTSLFNGDVLVQRIEDNLIKYGGALQGVEADGLRSVQDKLEQQKIVITENRIEMPVFDTGDFTIDLDLREGMEEVDYGWFDNAPDIKSRNNKLKAEKKKQIARVESQVRLNDNISIGGGFQGMDAPQSDAPTSDKDNYSQVQGFNRPLGKNDVQGKIATLNRVQNFAQVGHGGYNDFVNSGPEDDLTVYSNARSRITVKPELLTNPAKGKKAKQKESTIDSLISQAQQIDVIQEEVAVGTAIVAKGRRSVQVEFPVEGEAIYFEKLKDHAEIVIASARPADSKKLFWLILFAGCVVVLCGGERLASRRKKRAAA